MLDHLKLSSTAPPHFDPVLAGALERAAAAIARLDQAIVGHPLLPAFLYRARLEAVRRQAAVDGLAIDPWHLAAVLEGLRLRMDHALRIIDRGAIFDAARHALGLHQWFTGPDVDQEGEVQRAQRFFDRPAAQEAPLLNAALALHAWLDQSQTRESVAGDATAESADSARAAARAALVRYWITHRVLRSPLPLTGPKALRPETPWDVESWVPAFLSSLADEADDGLHMLYSLERAWFAARRAVAGRRSSSRAARAIDVLAAAPLVSATSLAKALGMAIKNATALLDGFTDDGLVIEVTHRSKRRLFGLAGLAPLRDGVAPPRRPQPGRGPGRPPTRMIEEDLPPPLPQVPLTRLERAAFDYSELDHWMVQADQAIRNTRRVLEDFRSAGSAAAGIVRRGEAVVDGSTIADGPDL